MKNPISYILLEKYFNEEACALLEVVNIVHLNLLIHCLNLIKGYKI